MSAELHLPDLPEVRIEVPSPFAGARAGDLGPLPPRAGVPRRVAWPVRLREGVSSYLPLLLMLLLALGTWWLVRNTPLPGPPGGAAGARSEPDYEMRGFAIERFAPDGRLLLRIEGGRLRHFADTDRIEIDEARIRGFGADGRVTVATARRVLGSGDGSELQLVGGAEVTASDATSAPIWIRSEFLHLFLLTERVRTHLPVRTRWAGTEATAAGLEYDHAARRLELTGPLRAVLEPRAALPAQGPR
jgi:lipopolysaccharide export system protein LptC